MLRKALEFCRENAALLILLWPILTGILTTVFRKPTPEETLAKPRWSAFRRLPSDMGLNLPKMMENLLILILGSKPKGPPPGTNLAWVCLVALSLTSFACVGEPSKAPGNDAQAIAQSTIALVAEGVRLADETCAAVVTKEPNDAQAKAIGLECGKSFDEARSELSLAEKAIELWAVGQHGDFLCSLSKAAKLLQAIVDTIRKHGGSPPDTVLSAIELGNFASCKGGQ